MFPAYFSRAREKLYIHIGEKLICDDKIVPLENGIFRFVSSQSYASAFGDQWHQYKKTQLDSYSKTKVSKFRLVRCLGPLSETIANKLVLEAGCGAGRFTEVLLDMGARVVSSDISSAADVNLDNFSASDHHLVIQSDINDMPFEDESFDIVVCLGVIQHTPNPENTIRNLYSLVKKGGHLVIDHYTFSRSYLFRTATLYRWFLRGKPAVYTIPYTRKLVDRYLPWHKKFKGKKLLSVMLNRISPVVSYYDAIPELNDKLQEEWAMLDTHDSLTDWYKHFRTKKSIERTLRKLGGSEIFTSYAGNGVEARCKKPII